MNPLKGKPVDHPKGWPWSSFSFYTNPQTRINPRRPCPPNPPPLRNPRRGGHPENQNRVKGWATRHPENQNRVKDWPTRLYKTSSGEIVVKGKGGIGAGEPTGINIKNLK
jgi:hypothetical protein